MNLNPLRIGPERLNLYLLVLLNLLPHTVHVPVWIYASALTLMVWRVFADLTNIPTPGLLARLALSVIAGFGVYFEYGSLVGDTPSTALLMILTTIKLFEIRSYRDFMFITYLCFFLLMTKLIQSQTILVTAFMVVDVVLILSLMAQYHYPQNFLSQKKLVRRSIGLSLQALPILVILFFIFPRFSGGLWKRSQSNVAVTEFTADINPGSISRLVQSDELAFRASFPDQKFPPPAKLYWRGATLDTSRGLQWTSGTEETVGRPLPPPEDKSDFVIQEIFIEPSLHEWLFALDVPYTAAFPEDDRSFRMIQKPGRVFESRFPLSKTEFYLAYSAKLSDQIRWPKPHDSKWLDVSVPEDEVEESRKLIESIKKDKPNSKMVVNRILEFFSKNGYVYSLSPPRVKTLDEFIFKTKEGFCEHYAGSMGSLLRLAGVPARVVSGFQGGSPSLLGDYLQIRFRDAHAWVEYWNDEESQWMRVDPTSVVAPGRLTMGGFQFNERLLERTQGESFASLDVGKWIGSDLYRLFLQARLMWDQAESTWIRMLLKFDFSIQKEWLSIFGIQKLGRFILFVLAFSGVILFLYFASRYLGREREKKDPLLEMYKEFCKKMARRGIVRMQSEGPQTFSQRIEQELEHSSESVEFMDRFIQLRYASNVKIKRQQIRDLKKLI